MNVSVGIRFLLGAVAIASNPAFSLPVVAMVKHEPEGNTFPLKSSAELSPSHRAELEARIRAILQQRVDSQERLEGQSPILVVGDVTFNSKGDRLTVELGKAYVPKRYGGEFEELINDLRNAVFAFMDPIAPIYKVGFTFEGKIIFDYFPYEKSLIEKADAIRTQGRYKRDASPRGPVLVSAGHGFYRHKAYGWVQQRAKENGVIEDNITQEFARTLSSYIQDRSLTTVALTRSTELRRHPESGKPWSAMAARYHLMSTLPDVPAIWNSKPGEGGDLEEYNQDIRSRPLYANYLSADVAIHLHTNASEDRRVRGIRVYHYPGRAADAKFAALALCYIKESLQANDSFRAFPVAGQESEGQHGENSYAMVPSIVVETGFHTNVDDANAMSNYVFRDLTMRGVEKGYRMFREGRGCEPFTVEHPEVNVASGAGTKASLVFGGAPKFPVKFALLVEECPSGIACIPRYGKFKDSDGPLDIEYTCHAEKDRPFTIKWNAVFTDADGIKAATPVVMNCKPKEARQT